MTDYFVNNNAQSNGDHEVHVRTCWHFPRNFTYLGPFNSCREAVAESKKKFGQSNGCKFCCEECHTG